MLLSIIIVSYNTKTLTLQAIESVLQTIQDSALLKKNTDVWVVDNNSTDGSQAAVATLREQHQLVHLIKNDDNLGFSAANNKGIEQSSGKYVLLLNSDTIVQDNALEKLVAQMEKSEELGILAAQLLNPDRTIQAQGGSFPTLASLASHMLLLDDLPLIGKFFPSTQHTGKNSRQHHTTALYHLDWVGGTAMLIRREVINEIGLLDSAIFMYGEDVEYCMRARHHLWQVGVLPSAQVLHFGSASSSSKNAILGELRSYLYIWAKHKPLWQMGLARGLIRAGIYLRRFLFGTMSKDAERALIYKEATQILKTA